MGHWIFLVNLVAFVSGTAVFFVLTFTRRGARDGIFRAYLFLFFCLTAISLMSLVDLYFEANLPEVRPGMRRGYFYTMALVVGAFNWGLTRLYLAVFHARFARSPWVWFVPGCIIALVAADFLFQPPAEVPPLIIQALKALAFLCAACILVVFFTPAWHVRRIADKNLRLYIDLSFGLFALLILLYATKLVAADRSEFFRFLGRVHYGVFFIVHNACVLFLALRPRQTPLSPPGEIPLSETFASRFALTPRERVIVREIIAGKSNREIARDVDVTEGTVKIFVHNIYKKTGVNNRMALAALVRQQAD